MDIIFIYLFIFIISNVLVHCTGYGFEFFMIHMLDIGIGIDGEIGLYCRKQHLDSFGNSLIVLYNCFCFFGCIIVTMIYHIDY